MTPQYGPVQACAVTELGYLDLVYLAGGLEPIAHRTGTVLTVSRGRVVRCRSDVPLLARRRVHVPTAA